MTVLMSFVSAKGSPGVTTTTLAVGSCWPRTAVVLDADPVGGDVPAGLGRAQWPDGARLADVVVDARSMSVEAALRRRVHRPAEFGPLVVAGFGARGQASGMPWHDLVDAFAQLSDADVLADCGRYEHVDGVAPVIAASDVVVLVTGSSLRAARATARVVPALRELLGIDPGDPQLSLVVVRPDQPYSSREIVDGCMVALLGEIPDEPGAAAVWSDGAKPGRAFARSGLQRAAARLAGQLSLLAPAGAGQVAAEGVG